MNNDDHLADLNHQNDSRTSVPSDDSGTDNTQSLHSIQDDTSDTQSQNVDTHPLQQSQSEAMLSSTSVGPDFAKAMAEHMVRAVLHDGVGRYSL
jgi:hypothetical protein